MTSQYTIKQYRRVFHEKLVENAHFIGRYDFPRLEKTDMVAEKAIPFHEAAHAKDRDQWVHFYIDDHRFECFWNNPAQYLHLLRSFQGVIAPDFSVFTSLPLAFQIWNTYRNRALACWLQKNDVPVIPNVRWGDEASFDWCFDGLPKDGTVAVSTNGCIRSKEDRAYFKRGLDEMVRRITPRTLVVYSSAPKALFDSVIQAGIPIRLIENYQITVRKGGER